MINKRPTNITLKLENSNRKLEAENVELKEELLSMQTGSMKYNPIFGGIPNPDGNYENIKAVLRDFFANDLEIQNVSNIQFLNVHRWEAKEYHCSFCENC